MWEVNGMNVDKMGIYVSIAVMVAVLGIVGILSGEFDLGLTSETKIPQITSSTNTDIQRNAFYEWCYKMNLEC